MAAIAGLCGLGLRPRATLEIPTAERRLALIRKLLRGCRYSFHDLSRVGLSHGVPRFNMPFELGLAVALPESQEHDWFVLEAQPHRLLRSLSDLNGTDPLIHHGRPERLLQALANVFDRPGGPEIRLDTILALLRRRAPEARHRYGSLYTRGAFVSLVAIATEAAAELKSPRRP